MLHVDLGLASADISQDQSIRSDESIYSQSLRGRRSRRVTIDGSNTGTSVDIGVARDEVSPTRTIHRQHTTYAPFYELETTPFILFEFPRIIFRWFYTFSLFLLLVFTALLLAVSPIDVIAQSSTASFSGIKVFIVIGVCVVFVIVTIFLYLLRILQNRVTMNDIPSKLVYIPGKGDIPNRCFEYIQKKWIELEEVTERAGPLSNNLIIINYPGLSPPQYVQERNLQNYNRKRLLGDMVMSCTGSILPPDTCYEDIMRSIGDKFKIDGRILTQIDLPRNLSFREVLIYVFNVYQSDPNFNFQVQDIPDIKRLIELYERMTFGLELIEELDILEFMIEFEKLIVYCTNNYNGKLTYRAATLPLLQLPPLQTAGGVISSGASYGRRRLYYDSSSFGRRNSAYSRYLYYRGDENKSHRSTKNSYSDYLGTEPLDFGDENHLINFDSKSNSHSSIGVSGSGIGRSGSYKSVIMNKLAIGRKGYREENDPDFNRDMGYASDNEGEFDFVDNQLDDELDDSYVENEDFDSIEPYHGKLQYQKSIGDQTNASDTSEMVATEPNDSEVANYDDKIDDNRNEEIHDDAKDDNDSDDADVFYGFRRKSIIQTD